jgi:hypothetical protein
LLGDTNQAEATSERNKSSKKKLLRLLNWHKEKRNKSHFIVNEGLRENEIVVLDRDFFN